MRNSDKLRVPNGDSRIVRLGAAIRRALGEFLKLPLGIVLTFIFLAAGTSFIDHSRIAWLEPLHAAIRRNLFRDSQATSDLLATISGSVITVTSITFSLLLLAVQQAAASLTHQVYDQFLRRRVNQVYFGFFTGLAVYTLVVLATVDPPYNPVFGASLALLLAVVALLLLLLLLYTTINQMRPVVVIDAIHDLVLAARRKQHGWIARTRRTPRYMGGSTTPVLATTQGYIVRLDIDSMSTAAGEANDNVEIVLTASLGSYVAMHDTIAEVRADSVKKVAEICDVVRRAIHLELQRDLAEDAAYGIEELATIGWTSVSTAKSNPSPGLLVIRSLRDLLARWSHEASDTDDANGPDEGSAVVYSDDVFGHLLNGFENLAVVASESMQPQTAAEFYRTFAIMFERVPRDWQARAEDMIRRSLSALGDHVLTWELDDALSTLIRTLDGAGRIETAAEVRAAQVTLAASIGKPGSRSTRLGGSRGESTN